MVDDGYQDDAVAKLGGHTPAGPLRGGKYSAFDGGTRVPFIVHWPGQVKAGVSNALLSQVDLLASLAALTGQKLAPADATDSMNSVEALLGKSQTNRPYVIEQALNNTLSIIKGNWKYIEPSEEGVALNRNVNIETGNNPAPQLYNLSADLGEKTNVAAG